MMMFYSGIHWDSGVEHNGSITPNKEVEDMAVKTSDESKSALFVVGDEETKIEYCTCDGKGLSHNPG